MWCLRVSCDIMLVSQLVGGQHIGRHEQLSYVIRNPDSHLFIGEGSVAMPAVQHRDLD